MTKAKLQSPKKQTAKLNVKKSSCSSCDSGVKAASKAKKAKSCW